MTQRFRRFLLLLCSVLFALPLLDCASLDRVDAPSQSSEVTLESLHQRNTKAFTAKVCVLPSQEPPGTRFIAADNEMKTIVSDQDRDAFERFLPLASKIFEFDLFARTFSAKLYPISMHLSCPETFEVLRAPEDVKDGESRFLTVVRISTDVHAELRLMVEQTCKTAELQRTNRLYVGQQIGKRHTVLLGRGNRPLQDRVAELLGLNRIPEPESSGPRSVTQQLRDTPEGQLIGGTARGITESIIPGGTVAVDLARAAHWLPEGTRLGRIAEASGELGVGVFQIAIGCTGIVAGTGLTGTGGGAPAGVPILVGSFVLTTAGVVNVGNSIRHLTIELWRSDESEGMVATSPASEASPTEPTPQTAKPAPTPEPAATTPAVKPAASSPVTTAAGSGQTTIRNVHLAGKKHPKTGVPFDKDGYPDFRAAGLVQKEVKIKFSGDRKKDEALANAAAGLKERPKGSTWHHHQDGTTMQLVPFAIHEQTGHTGGFSGTRP